MTTTAIQQVTTEDVKQAIMTANPIQQVTTEDVKQAYFQLTIEDVKQAILALIREDNAEFKALFSEILTKKKKKTVPKKQKSKIETPITVIEGERVPYSEMPFWKANPHLKRMVLTEKNHHPAKGDFATAMKKAQEAFSDLDVTDEEWLLQIQD